MRAAIRQILFGAAPAFIPLAWFRGGEQGAWYDPSDLSSMFQDAAGTTPAALEQPVGLMLDKSKGLALGPELVTGSFINGVDYPFNSFSASGTGFIATKSGYGYGQASTPGISIKIGQWYKITIQVNSANYATTFYLQSKVGGGGFARGTAFSFGPIATTTTVTGYIQATHTETAYFAFSCGPSSSISLDIASVSIKESSGNHASQTTIAARPVLSARYNLLTYTEDFSNAAYLRLAATIQTNATTAPDGTTTADKLVSGSGQVQQAIYRNLGDLSGAYTWSICVKAAGCNYLVFTNNDIVNTSIIADLTTGTIKFIGSGLTNSSITNLGDGWYRLTTTFTGGGANQWYVGLLDATNNNFNGNGVDGLYIWGADLRVANDGVNLPPYQRVGAATDYDSVGFPQRVVYDRVDDAHTVAAGGGSTTAFFFCAAIRLNATGATQTIYSDTGTNTGYRIRINSSNQLEMAVGNGSAYTTVNTTDTFSLGERAVITCWHDGANIYAQKNRGAVASQSFATASAGTAGFTLGKDNGAASSFFGGGIYEYVHVKNAYKGDGFRAQTQAYCAAKALVTL